MTNNETKKVFEPTEKSRDSQRIFYTFTDKEFLEGTYTLEISGAGYKYFSQSVEIQNNTTTQLSYTNGYDCEYLSVVGEQSIIGVIGIGDINQTGAINNDDEQAMINHIQSGSKDLTYDLNGDNEVNIIDLSYISINKDTENHEYKNADYTVRPCNIANFEGITQENFEHEQLLMEI